MAYGALQSFVWDFGRTALSSLQFLNEIFVDAPILRIKAIPQHRAMFPTLWDKCLNYSTSPIDQYSRDAREGAYGFFVLIREDWNV